MESPLSIALTGAFFAGLCIYAWFQNGRRELLLAVAGIVAVTVALLALERWWVTEDEAIENTIRQIARDVESNDFNRMVVHFHPIASDIRELARAEVNRYDFESITVKNNFEIQLDMRHQPPKAIVGFNAVAVLSEPSLGVHHQQIPRFIEFLMYKDSLDGKWKIADYGHRSALPGQSDMFERRLPAR